jgi:hypothetical protein
VAEIKDKNALKSFGAVPSLDIIIHNIHYEWCIVCTFWACVINTKKGKKKWYKAGSMDKVDEVGWIWSKYIKCTHENSVKKCIKNCEMK